MKHIMQYSGGIGSYVAAKRLVQLHGKESVLLLFADTKDEDEDLYRFIDESKIRLGCEFIPIADGRSLWEVFNDVGFIGNSRIDPCSKHLKRNLLKKWIKQNATPKTHTIQFGIDWSEYHRLERLQKRWAPWIVGAPLCDRPYLTKSQMMLESISDGIEPPRLYKLGFPHNNCGGFCVKAGKKQFELLLKTFPDRYKRHEDEERRFRQARGKDVSVLRETIRGKTVPITMEQLRLRIEAGEKQPEFDFGGCGCAVD